MDTHGANGSTIASTGAAGTASDGTRARPRFRPCESPACPVCRPWSTQRAAWRNAERVR